MEIGKKFNDQKSYNASMGRAIDDKLFFLDKLNLKEGFVMVDFGCADGTVLQEIEHRYSKEPGPHAYIGFDISESMIQMAREKWDGESEDVAFTNNWDQVVSLFKAYQKTYKVPRVLILSSVLHELYSYSSPVEIELAWTRIFSLGVDYIVFRDMMWSTVDIDFDISDYLSVVESKSPSLVQAFEKVWGPIVSAKDLTHFLLKYRYTVNWDREVNEDYFPILFSDFLAKISKKYEPEYLERAALPYIQGCIQRDYGFHYPIKTHLKGIFKCKPVGV